MNIETMKELIEYKDKIKASQAKRTAFSQEWLSYVSENGFDEIAEQYLFSGFEYRKMHPFVDYLKTIECKKDAVLKFLNGKQFSKNRPKSFKMALSLLVILFTELPEERSLMVYVIRRLPPISFGKDKKRIPEVGKAFEKFFFPEFTEATTLPDLKKMPELKPVIIDEFRALISDATIMLLESGEIDERIKRAYELTINWNKGIADVETQEASDAEVDVCVQKDLSVEVVSKDDNADNEHSTEVKVEVPTISWKSSLRFVADTIERLEFEVKSLKCEQAARDHVIGELREQASKRDSALTKAVEDANALRKKEAQMREEIESLKVNNAELNETIQEKDREIEDRSKFAEMLSKDTSKQSDAVLKRLSSDLASYYEDFMAAESETVTEEIGSILKDQLAEIFVILKKNGIKLQ